MALTRELRAPLLIALLAAGVLATAVSTVASRSGTHGTPGAAPGPTSVPLTPAPSQSPRTTAPQPSPTPAPTPTAEPSSSVGGASGGSDGGGGGEPVGGPMPGSKPKDGWPDVHGVVTDAQGNPLAGIFVTKESNVADAWLRDSGAVTDAHGRFRLRCPTDSRVTWRSLFVSVFPVSGDAPASGLHDGAWQRITPACGLADDPDVVVRLAPGADVTGTLYAADGTADIGTHDRIGAECDGLPHGFINGFAPQVSFSVDPKTARFRVYGLDSDHCTLGVITPDGTRTKLSGSLTLTEGHVVHEDLHAS